MSLENSEEGQLFDKFDKLRTKFRASGLNDEIELNLPSIVIIGSQSSGKSSTLENLVGSSFLPQGTNMQTKCPIEIRLRRDNTLADNQVEIKVEDDLSVKTQNPDKNATYFKSFEGVDDEIRRRQEILMDNESSEYKQDVTDMQIILTIRGRKFFNLTLVDLPGFIDLPLEHQNPNINQNIQRLCQKFCEPKNTIALAVHEATLDIGRSQALRFMRRFDPQLQRTLLVLTKPDLIKETDANSINRAKDILSKSSEGMYSMKYDCFMVKNTPNDPTKKCSDLTFDEKIKDETEYFVSSPFNNYLNQCGANNLTKLVSNLLADEIKKAYPKVQAQIRAMKNKLSQEIREFESRNQSKLGITWRRVVADYIKLLNLAPKGLVADNQNVQIDQTINTGLVRDMLSTEMENFLEDSFVVQFDSIFTEEQYQLVASRVMATNVDMQTSAPVVNYFVRKLLSAVAEKFSKEYLITFQETWSEELSNVTRNFFKKQGYEFLLKEVMEVQIKYFGKTCVEVDAMNAR